jgi:hypothetical protein
MRRARFKVIDTLDNAGGVQKGTVEIDRTNNLLIVRPYRKHRTYTMPLGMVATMVCRRIILNELAEKRKAKANKKKRKQN